GVRIRSTDNQSGNSQTLYYFTTDISDGGIKSAPGFLKFCQRLGSGSSFLKASSYLMFEQGFGTIRNFILDHSNRIVQDDSGIPLAYFDPNKWNLRLFGVYLGPIDLFKQHYQPRLQEIFRQSNPPPLDSTETRSLIAKTGETRNRENRLPGNRSANAVDSFHGVGAQESRLYRS